MCARRARQPPTRGCRAVNPLRAEKGLKVHDDRLVSGALAAVLDGLLREGKVTMGRGESAVIEGVDPLEEVEF